MNKKAFTLIELLIVIAIIGILAVAFLPSLLGGPAKARDAQRMTDLKKLSDFLTYHYNVGTSGLTFPTNNYCIKPSSSPTGLNKFINDHLADLGGVFPTEPLPTWDAYYGNGTGTPLCKGGYGLYVHPSSTFLYKFSLYTYPEVKKNKNSCYTYQVSTAGTCTPWWYVIPVKR